MWRDLDRVKYAVKTLKFENGLAKRTNWQVQDSFISFELPIIFITNEGFNY